MAEATGWARNTMTGSALDSEADFNTTGNRLSDDHKEP